MHQQIVSTIALSLWLIAGSTAGQGRRSGSPLDDAPRIHLADSDTVIAVWSEPDPDDDERSVSRYAISFDAGETFPHERVTSYELRLRYARFDPLVDLPFVPGGLRVDDAIDHAQMYIVQFVTQPLKEYRRDIRAAGGTIYKFLAHHAYLVRLDPDALAGVARLPYVRWIGVYQPAYKVEESLLEPLIDDRVALARTRVNIQVFERGVIDKRVVADRVRALGGVVNAMSPDGSLLEATLDEPQLREILHLPEVLFVDRWGEPEVDMNIAREIGGANFVENVGGFTGEGVRAEVMDTNILSTHQDFQDPPPVFHGQHSGSTSHGTSVYGINFGDGTGNSAGRGMVPDAQGIFADFGFLTNRHAHTAELVRSPYFAVYQTNSWGDPRTTLYTTKSFEMDDIIFRNDIVICQSQSNSGNRLSRPQAWAKNVVAVGGVRHLNTLTKSDDRWGGGASTGPAFDGRVKPDLTHFYDSIFTTSASGGYTSGFGGTSGATPIVAGHFGVFFQMWSEGIFGNEVDPGATVFDNRSHATTAKAMIINSAAQYNWRLGGSNADLTRFRQGWGMPDLRQLYEDRDRIFVVDEDVILENLETATFQLPVESGAPEFRATLVYLDPAGTTSSDLHRINDLTLKVTSPGGVVYFGNNGLIADVWSAPGGSPNTIDTVENVFVQNPEAGVWTVEVIASEINEDSHVETQTVDADFALVVAGVIPPAGAASLVDLEIRFGERLFGGINRLRASDDRRLGVGSAIGFSTTEPNIVELLLGFQTEARPAKMDIVTELHIDHPVGTTILGLRNWSDGRFEEVARYASGPVEEVVITANVEAIGRVRDSDGRIELSMKQVVIATFSISGFQSLIDHVAIGVN